MSYQFAEFTLDTERAELLRNGDPVHVEPQVFDLLKLLVSAQGRVVTKDEIFHAIWGDRVVSDAALASRIRDARKAIGDDGSTQRFIRTVQRRGLRFVGDAADVPEAPVAPPAEVRVDVMRRPAVAVLPFTALAGDEAALDLADGVSDELVSALSAWRYFPVISGTSTACVSNQGSSADAIGRALDARYLVTGAVREAGDRLKVKVRLTDTETGTQIWSDKIRCQSGELFDLEEELAARIVTLLAPELEQAEARRVVRKEPGDMTAWELTMRASWLLNRRGAAEMKAAEALAQRAAQLAPDWGLPMTLIASARFQQAMLGFSNADSSEAFAPTLEAAQQALEIDPTAWFAHALTGVGELWTNQSHDRALLHVEKAISLNPSASMIYHFGGCITGFAGDPEQARAYQERLFRVDPTYRHRAVIEADLALWHVLEGDYAAAEDRLQQAHRWDAQYGRAWQRRLALSGLTGDEAAARYAAEQLDALGLCVDVEKIAVTYPFRNPDHAALFERGLRAALELL